MRNTFLTDLTKKFLIVTFLLGHFQFVFADSTYQSQYDEQENMSVSLAEQTKSDLMIITAAGLGGAVLGLSTLSFAKKPSEKTGNILTGAAIGVILGVVYVAYRQAFGTSGAFTADDLQNMQDSIPVAIENERDKFTFLYSYKF